MNKLKLITKEGLQLIDVRSLKMLRYPNKTIEITYTNEIFTTITKQVESTAKIFVDGELLKTSDIPMINKETKKQEEKPQEEKPQEEQE